ncbi:S9 family peptidase [Paraferrimonas haliotis]|uniref:Periplasmic peptidase family S9 n=1 Tax=Paraferrimonas haliotis TaxID=2013866 RepID=A0AA37TRG2_9GAMM|nr:prolyl oligopeptidase family serine peptidase [Paraferrimonas haliotis]GLS82962.1 periplasmic peptidase family S9 [Paraferrimonas haliotis]
MNPKQKARLVFGAAALLFTSTAAAQAKLTLEDVMVFETIQNMQVSANGEVIAYTAQPDRGDGRGIVAANGAQVSVKRGTKAVISDNSQFVLFEQGPSLLDYEKASPKERKSLDSNRVLVNVASGKQTAFNKVEKAQFNRSSSALALHLKADKKDEKAQQSELDKADLGQPLQLLNLSNNAQQTYANVTSFQLAEKANFAIVAMNDAAAKKHQVVVINLDNFSQQVLASFSDQQIGQVAISDNALWTAFTYGELSQPRALRQHQLEVRKSDGSQDKKFEGLTQWKYSVNSQLQFSSDEQRLFVGRSKVFSEAPVRAKIDKADDLTDTDVLLKQRDLIVWHGDDPRIKPNEAKQYSKKQAKTYWAVLHLEPMKIVQLADESLPEVEVTDNAQWLLASSNVPYLKMMTWAGAYQDFYLVNVQTGERTLIVPQQSVYQPPKLSPNANFAVYYVQGDWFALDLNNGRKRNLTTDLNSVFANEDHDYPSSAPGYGLGPWLEDGSKVLIYDKYDVWQFDLINAQATKLTDGRDAKISYRVVAAKEDDFEQSVYQDPQQLLLKGFNYDDKTDSFYQFSEQANSFAKVDTGAYKIDKVIRAKDVDTVLFTKENYQTFPDYFLASKGNIAQATKVTDLGKQTAKFAWGSPQLVRWMNGDGRELDGALFLPPGYKKGDKVPVMVYYYRFMSQRLTEFPKMFVNHRPNFAWYNANGYAVFLPDIRFEVGYPGQSAVDSLVSGVQKIIEMGIADPDKIGVHGHSWSGYQTAFAVTQTHIFKAAVSGAPVSNMTSAYSGIRHGTGLARQFQYEAGQSRIGPTLYKQPFKYWENSPIAHVERIKTPMLIMFGDVDDAVPWEQGIELYMAMRRTGKDVIMLQYQDEPHHLKKYPNKVDYSIRMKQYFDHYLLGKPAPEWMTNGEAFYQYRKD